MGIQNQSSLECKIPLFYFLEKDNTSGKNRLTQTENILSLFDAKHYNVGSPIWIYYEDIDELGILCLPQSFNQRGCTTASPIRYMEDLENKRKCQIHLYFDEECSAPEFDINYYFDGFKVVKSPEHFKNYTKRLPNSKYPYLEIDYKVCSKSLLGEDTFCENKKEIELVSMKPNKLCRNIVTGLDFEVFHEGTNGITKINVTIELSDFSSNRTFWEYLDEDFMIIEQAFSYRHVWKTDNSTAIIKRSGRPGYQNDMPIRSGNLIQFTANGNDLNANERISSTDNNKMWKIESRENEQYLTIMGTTLTGDCNDVLLLGRYYYNPLFQWYRWAA